MFVNSVTSTEVSKMSGEEFTFKNYIEIFSSQTQVKINDNTVGRPPVKPSTPTPSLRTPKFQFAAA